MTPEQLKQFQILRNQFGPDLVGRIAYELSLLEKGSNEELKGISDQLKFAAENTELYEQEERLNQRAAQNILNSIKEAIELKDVDLSEILKGLAFIVKEIRSGNQDSIELLQAIERKGNQEIVEGLIGVEKAITEQKTDLSPVVTAQQKGFNEVVKILTSLSSALENKKHPEKMEVEGEVSISEPSWLAKLSFMNPLEKLLESFSKRTFKVSQAEPFEVVIKGLPNEIAEALGKEIQRVMPRAMPGAGYNNPFSFDAEGNLKITGGSSGGGGDASEATLQDILAAVDTLETGQGDIVNAIENIVVPAPVGGALESTQSKILSSFITMKDLLRSIVNPPWLDKTLNRLRQTAIVESGTITTVTTVTTVASVTNTVGIDGYQGKLLVINQNNSAWANLVRSTIS